MSQKAIIITGASQGIGHSLTLQLATMGYIVVAVARNQEKLDSLSANNKNIVPVCADITKQTDRKILTEAVNKLKIPVDLINNAGIVHAKPMNQLTEAEWTQTLQTNLEAPYWLFRELLPYFDHSRILNISSGLAHFTLPGTGIYSISKAALYMLYQVINTECNPDKVIAGSVRPGKVDTYMQQNLRAKDAEAFPSTQLFKDFYAQGALRNPDDVARYIINILLNTSDEEFKKKEWNIED